MCNTKKIRLSLGQIESWLQDRILDDLDFVEKAGWKQDLNCYFRLNRDSDTKQAELLVNRDGVKALKIFRGSIAPELWNLA